tara:strand:+ start:82 stop:333 length:252 start_codon:yes stop_codon:yes gene_type:complete
MVWEICRNCQGEGQHKYIDEGVLYGYGETQYLYDDCKACKGSGKINDIRTAEEKKLDEEWLEEIAMEEGMLNGIDAYNEVKGY